MIVIGIIALILAVLFIFVPLFGPILTVIPAFLAVFAFGPGISYGIIAICINIGNILFFSPTLWLAANSTETASADSVLKYGMVLVSVQVIAFIILFFVHRSWKKRQKFVV